MQLTKHTFTDFMFNAGHWWLFCTFSGIIHTEYVVDVVEKKEDQGHDVHAGGVVLTGEV